MIYIVFNLDGGICIDEHLDTPYNDFERGHVDSFTGTFPFVYNFVFVLENNA